MSENEERYGTAKLFVYAVVLYEANKEPHILRLFLRRVVIDQGGRWR